MYLFIAFAFSLFRFVMYALYHEHVTKVKIDSSAWKIKEVREVAMAYTGSIRTFMGFRALVFGWGLTLVEQNIVSQLAHLSLFVDIYLWVMLLRHYRAVSSINKKEAGAIQYQNNIPLYLQTCLVLSGILIFM